MSKNSDEITKWPERAPHRSLFNSMGISDDELEKPIIGIANSWNELVPGHVHLDKLAEEVKKGITDNGGLGLEFNTIALCDGIAMGHDGMETPLPSREIIADSIELTTQAYKFDGLVLIANCDKIEPGMIMGAIRTNIPTIVLTGGPMLPGKHRGKKQDYSTVIEAVSQYKQGEITEKELNEIQHKACPGPGSCAGMFTANTMASAIETMGLSLPKDATTHAETDKKKKQAYRTGKTITELIENNTKIKDIITKKSILNAAMVDLALGGSTNSVLHLLAIAEEAEIKFKQKNFNQLSEKIPHLVNMSPAGPHELIDLHKAGGIPTVLQRLQKELHLNQKTVKGTLKNRINNKKSTEIIKTKENPVHKQGGIKILYGNIAPNGAVVKQTAVSKKMMKFKGKAKVFNSEEECVKAIDNNKINKGEVIVIRYEGPKGGPGMREMLTPTSRISGSKLNGEVALITDGRFSGATRGAAIGHISPEAIEKGPISIIKNGDPIQINIPKAKINLKIPKQKIEKRLKQWKRPKTKTKNKTLDRYHALAKSANKGATLKQSNKIL